MTASELTFTGPAESGCLDHIHDLMAEAWVREPGVSTDDKVLFATAVAEVAANIVSHGQSSTGTEVTLTLRLAADQIEAVFLDDGDPADVDVDQAVLPADSAESGRGLAIARAALDELAYERLGSINRWRLVRSRSSPAPVE